MNGCASGFDIAEIRHPATVFPNRPTYINGYVKRVAVQASTLVILGDVGQFMGCLEGKGFENIHACYIVNEGRQSY